MLMFEKKKVLKLIILVAISVYLNYTKKKKRKLYPKFNHKNLNPKEGTKERTGDKEQM